MGVRGGDGLHGLEAGAGVALGVLGREDGGYVVLRVGHDLAEQHVLEGGGGGGGRVLRVVALERLDEVGVRGGEVAVLGVQLPALHVQPGLQEGGQSTLAAEVRAEVSAARPLAMLPRAW